MTTTLAGHPVTGFSLTIPRVGLWSAEVEVDADAVLSGEVELSVDGVAWRGTVYRGGVELARGSWRIVGASALHGILSPQAFRNTTLREVFAETVRDAGCTLADDLGDLSAAVTAWHRRAAPAAHTLSDVAKAAGLIWRATATGAVWCGADAWTAEDLGADVEVLDVDPSLGRVTLAGQLALTVTPGITLTVDGAAFRVGLVEHRQHGAALRTVVWSERETDLGSDAGRLRAAIVAIVRSETRRVDYHALHPALVVSQDGAGGPVDLRPESESIAPPQAVPLRVVNGVKLTLPAGTRVLLGYEAGDPSKPYAVLADYAAVTRFAVNGASTKAAREGDNVTASGAFTTWLTTVGTATGAGAPPSTIGAISGGSDVVRIP